jgi:hypothetical protein
MAWGRSTPTVVPAPPSTGATILRLLPLFVLIVILGIVAFIAYHVTAITSNVANETSSRLQRKNVTLSKDGVVVGVHHRSDDKLVEGSQNFVVKAWNLSKWPAYKSRFWNKQAPEAEVVVVQPVSRKR